MNKKNFLRGYPIIFINNQWVFEDTKEPTATTWKNKPCGYCKKHNTIEGHDGCLGSLPNIMNACCGHGRKKDAYVQFLDSTTIHGYLAFIVLNKLKIFKILRKFYNGQKRILAKTIRKI